MWGDPDPDPGETRPNISAPSPQELSDLKDQNEQQLVLISQLKEMLRKEQSTVSQEKVEEYVNTLNRNKAKRSFRQKREGSGASNTGTTSSVGIDASKKERINLLRQQMEENKARLAERGKSQRGIEEMVNQLQAQLKDNQTLISASPSNASLVEAKNLEYNESTPQKDLYNILLTKERRITELLTKSQKLESTVMDLQENLKEKDSVIDARTKAITLMTDSLSKKGKSTLDALDETKEQMRNMQGNFVTLEAEMKARQLSLLNDLKLKNFEISDLQQANSQLEKEKIELEKHLSEIQRPDTSAVSGNIAELDQLQTQLNRYQEDNQRYLQKINELEARTSEATFDQNKYKLEEELEEAMSKLKVYEEKVLDLEENVVKSSKNEASRLLEENKRLANESLINIAKIAELENQLENTMTELKLLKVTDIDNGTKKSGEKEEILKLKKQLEESNKNMIKMRATQKGKIKELNKKLEQFRKMNDSNALIAQLQNEISKLNEKIAELEDEKGNLQLKMVESTSSSKEDPKEQEDQFKELQDKLTNLTEELGEKTKVIEILESEVLSLKANLKQKSDEEVKVSSQVSSEISSIHYEEQIEKIEMEKNKLTEELENIKKEKEDILKEMEHLKKEKQDMATKLDNYIQENMDLIDKLEKLSAEKVSSAESIEIVEGLTKQEQLELAAYQKHISPEENPRGSDEDNMEAPAELNESVLQLSEDTVELLQKIEMFTHERKEVMQKMETLKEENNLLSLKVKEIENNRDILEETYEQLQNEKEALTNEKQELLAKLDTAHNLETSNRDTDQSAEALNAKLEELQIKCQDLVQENDDLKRTLKEFDSKIQEKHDIDNRLREMIENNTSLETKLSANLEEINSYKLTIEENKNELVHYSKLINEFTGKLEDRERSIEELKSNITDLNNVIGDLQTKNDNYEAMETELQNLKAVLTDQISQADNYESEMAQSSESMQRLNNELVHMNRRILELENELDLKDSEIDKVKKDLNNKEEIIKNLQSEIAVKDQKFKTVSEEIKDKYLQLQKQLDSNGDSLKEQINELNNKNKEQLEKMKKIAANLKKKTQAYQQLEDQFKVEKEKWESETTEKDNSIQESQRTILSLRKELMDVEEQLKLKLEENRVIQSELAEFRQKIEILEQNNADQQHFIQELKRKQEKLQEVSLQQEMSASLHEDIDDTFPKNVHEEKVRELELLLETNESELNHYKERMDKFEESIRKLEEEKVTLENINTELIEKLNLTSNSFKEKALLEDQLELRLAEVTANDEALSKKLQEMQNEQEELRKKNQEYEELIKKLKLKLKKAHDKVTELKTVQSTLQDLETANQELKNQVASLEANQRHIQNENESLQKRNMSDYEKIEADYQVQLEELLRVKNELTVENEKLLEKLKEMDEKEQELLMELEEIKLKLTQSENVHIEQINRLTSDIENIKVEQTNTQSENLKLKKELDENLGKVQQSQVEADRLSQELNNLRKELHCINDSQEKVLYEKGELESHLKLTREQLEYALMESDSLKRELYQLGEKHQFALQENDILKCEINNLKHEIQALEFAKSSLEASYESSQKIGDTKSVESAEPIVFDEFSQHSVKETEGAVPTFHWHDQPQTSTDLFDHLGQQSATDLSSSKQPNTLVLNIPENSNNSVSEVDSLKQQLVSSNEKLQSALQDVAHLRAEADQLKLEIQALQFAKASLEASYESSQKLQEEKGFECPQAITLQNVLHKNSKSNQEAPQESSLPLFESFLKPQGGSAFDSFDQVLQKPNQWPTEQNNQQTSFNKNLPVSGTSNMQIEQFSNSRQFSPVIEDNREALLKKIKTLEFLLYSIDKEKEIALEQCTEMVNELTRVIYNQVNPTEQAKQSFSEVESQILSDEAVRELVSNKTQLQETEYTPINVEFGEQSVPVNEEALIPQKAYICFDDDHPSKKQESLPEHIKSQLISEKDITDCASNKKELQRLEYERVDKSLGEQHQAVVEPLAQAKHAYLCYTKDDKPQSFDAFEENDDGWGWGPEEARLEEEHMSNVENTPQVKTLLLEIQHLKDTIRVFQVERENHLEEIKQLQIKSGKLIKKYKEIKAKADHASTSNRHDDGGFFDLNETIQEELKEQIKQLEKMLKEINTELEREKLEKEGFVKRVDVLTAANERMMEMKEIQDSEVFRWQRKHQEVVEKLQEFEWKNDGFQQNYGKTAQEPLPSTSGPVSDSARIQELENTIRDLTLDNEELQTLLEEQNARRIEAEKNKTSANDQELSELRSLNALLCKELDEIKLKDVELLDKVNSDQQEKSKLIKEKSELEALLHDKEERLSKLEKTHAAEVINEQFGFQNEILTLKKNISAFEAQLQEKDLILVDLQNNLEQLNQRKLALDQKAKQLSSELSESKSESLALKTQIQQLNLQVNEKDKVIDDLNGFIDNFERDKNKIGQMKEQIRSLTEEMSRKDLEFKQTLDALMSTATQSEEYKRMVVGLQEYVKEMEIFGAEKSRKAMECRQLEEDLEAKSLEIMRKEQQIEDLELEADKLKEKLADYNKLKDDLHSKMTEIETITAEKLSKDVQIQQLLLELQNKDQEFEERTSILINELNEKWQIQVDQRGEDIAESWKMHLEMVEKEHNAAQEKLKTDLIEFEEKCNILVNENNELRKNVDQEIRNEVDKLSALQQQISNLNQTINSLNLELQDKVKKIEELQNNLSNYLSLENELQTLRNDNIEKEKKLSSINIIIETTQKQFDEKREVVEEIVAILEKNASSPISYEKQEILKEFQKQLETGSEKDAEVLKLNKKLNELEQTFIRTSGENQREITGLNQVIEDFEKELSMLHEKESEILRLTMELNNSQKEQDVLQQKIAEIKHEQDNLAPEYEKVKQELVNTRAVVEDYKQKVQEYYERNLELERALAEKTKDIIELNENILRLQKEAKNDSNKEAEVLSDSVSKAKEEYVALQGTLAACQNDLYTATQQLEQKSHELEQTRQSLFYYQQHYEAFEEEIIRLKKTLDEREMEYTEYIEMIKNNQSTDAQKQYDELILKKDSDIKMLQAQNQEIIKHIQDYSERLNQELAIRQQLEEKLNERTQIVDEDTKQLEELKLIIEDQVVKIEELKKQLFDKSNQYDSLIAEVDVGRQPVTQQPIASLPAANQSALETAQSQKYADDDLTEPVSRAELDLALYMLHQRDVRCEELTVELTQLLEERDTLQLRLSNAIREKEELRRNITGSPVPTTSSERVDSSPISKSSAIFLAASGTELAKDPLASETNLATKLSELRNMGYKKDKTFVDEQDARRLQQLVLMQQHINEASKLPPEAAARLVDASYTLSRDVQSPSKVLLNWLWGKNPPKANNDS